MIRRNARLRREYIFRKSLKGKERAEYEKRRKIQKALQEGKPVPSDLRNEYDDLKAEMDAQDASNQGEPNLDDEYGMAGVIDPKVLVSTARGPSPRLTQFAKEVNLCIPNATRLNRGSLKLKELIDAGRSNQYTDVVVLHEHQGLPDGLIVSHLPHGPTAYFALSDVVMRHDIDRKKIGTMSEQYPHLIFDNFSTEIGKRVSNILKFLFPVPKPDSRRIMTFQNRSDFVLFRHHVYKKGENGIELQEIGPRWTMRLYQIRLGTLEQSEAELEWVLRPYMNTARKRKVLG